MFLSNALIGLREGLEAGMLITVLVAFLNGRGRHRIVRLVWFAVGSAVLVAATAGTVIAILTARLAARGQALFAAGASTVAIVLITWMIFWMQHSVSDEYAELEEKTSRALRLGPTAVFMVAFVTVVREGVEAAIFVVVLSGQGGAAQSVAGLLFGVVAAVLVIWALHAGLLRISLARLFTITGPLLAIIAAGVVAHTLSELQDVHVLPGADAVAFDASRVLEPHSFLGELIAGLTGFSARPTILATACWGTYLIVVLTLFRLAVRRTPAAVNASDAFQAMAVGAGESR